MKKQTLFGKDKETIKTILFWVLMFELTTKWILGDISVPLMVLLIAGYLTIIFMFVMEVIMRFKCDRMYIKYMKDYEYLEETHKYRYKLYFSNERDEIQQCTDEIQEWGEIVLHNGEILIATPRMTKAQITSIRQRMDKARELMQKEFVIY